LCIGLLLGCLVVAVGAGLYSLAAGLAEGAPRSFPWGDVAGGWIFWAGFPVLYFTAALCENRQLSDGH
jgi:hypothetical protein